MAICNGEFLAYFLKLLAPVRCARVSLVCTCLPQACLIVTSINQ
jgi:hypothetical protein